MTRIWVILYFLFFITFNLSVFSHTIITLPEAEHPNEKPPRFGLLEHFGDFGKVVDRKSNSRSSRIAAKAQQELEMEYLHDHDLFSDHAVMEMSWNDVEVSQGCLNLFPYPREAEVISNQLSCSLRIEMEGIPEWIGEIFYDPEIYSDYETFLTTEDETGLTGEEKLQLWEEYAGIVAASLGERTTYYNLLREPNNTLFPPPNKNEPCPEESDWGSLYAPVFHDLYVRAARAIRANDPDATVSGSGLLDAQNGPDNIFCPKARQSYVLVDHLTEPGRFEPSLDNVLDAFSFHIYPEYPSHVNDSSFGRKVDLSSSHSSLLSLMDRLETRLSLELNEYGYRFEESENSTRVEEFASVLIRIFSFSISEGLKNALFFEVYDYYFDGRDRPPNADERTRYLLKSRSDFNAVPPVLQEPEWTVQAEVYRQMTRLFSAAVPDEAFNASAPAPGDDLVWRRFTTASGDLVSIWSNDIGRIQTVDLRFEAPTNDIKVFHFFIDGSTSEENLAGNSAFEIDVLPFESVVVQAVRGISSASSELMVDEGSNIDFQEDGSIRAYVGAPVRFWWPMKGRLEGRLVVKKSETNPGAGMIRVDGRFEPLEKGRCTVYLLDGLKDHPVASLEVEIVNLCENLLPGPDIAFVQSAAGSHQYRSIPLFWQTSADALASPASRFDQGGSVWIDRDNPSTFNFGSYSLEQQGATFLGRGAFGLYGETGTGGSTVFHVPIRNTAMSEKIRLGEDYFFAGWCRIDGGGAGLNGRLPIIPLVGVEQKDSVGDNYPIVGAPSPPRVIGNDAVLLSRDLEPGQWFEITSHHGLFPDGKIRFSAASDDPERTPGGAILSFNVYFHPNSYGSVLFDELYFGPFPESGLLILQPDGIRDSVVETNRLDILPYVDLENFPTASRLHASLVTSPSAEEQYSITPKAGVDFRRQPVIAWENITSFLDEHAPDYPATHGVIRLELRDLYDAVIAVKHSAPFEIQDEDFSTAQPTETPTVTPTVTFTNSVTETPTSTETPTQTPAETVTETSTMTPTETFEATGTPTSTKTFTTTPTGTVSSTPVDTATSTPSPSQTPEEPTLTPTPTATSSPRPFPTVLNPRTDINEDGMVDNHDLLLLRQNWHRINP